MTFINLLRTLSDKEKKRWSKHLNMLTKCYNSTLHSLIELTPHFLFFGRHPTLPIDDIICFAVDTVSDNINEDVTHKKINFLLVSI